jgi:PIN domain nuclease of toxin-antitoxin system
MKLLPDTCTFLWLIADRSKLSSAAIQSLIDFGNHVFFSVVSEWETAVLVSLGRLTIHGPLKTVVPNQRATHRLDLLPLSEAAALHVADLPRIHRDPFDRMLICPALVDGLTVVTPDPLIHRYSVPILW